MNLFLTDTTILSVQTSILFNLENKEELFRNTDDLLSLNASHYGGADRTVNVFTQNNDGEFCSSSTGVMLETDLDVRSRVGSVSCFNPLSVAGSDSPAPPEEVLHSLPSSGEPKNKKSQVPKKVQKQS